MITVKQLIQAKGNAVWSITPDSTVYEALKLLAENEDEINLCSAIRWAGL